MYVEFQLHLIINRYFLPCLLIIGTAGNIISLVVLSRPNNLKHSTARFMLVLAVSDLLSLWLVISYKWIDSMYGINIRDYSVVMCKLHMTLVYTIGQISMLLIVALNIERAIALNMPLQIKSYCNLRNANSTIRAIPFISLVFSGHMFYAISINENEKCSLNQAIYNQWIWWIFRALHAFVLGFISIVIVFFVNICICSKLVKNKCRKYGKKTNAIEGQAYKGKMSKIFLTLSLVTILFVICYTPIGIYSLTYSGEQMDHGNSHEDAQILLYFTVSSSLTLVNNVFNFFIYFLRGTKFRKEARNIFCKKNKK